MTRVVFILPAIFALFLFPVAGQTQSVKKPKTFLIDQAFLAASKAGIAKGDTELVRAKKALVNAADEACKRGPYSVTNKGKLPPSGDKHDYMSVGPYWWPDTTKPNGLPYIRRDGQNNPERPLASIHYQDLDLAALQQKLVSQAGHPYISVLSNSVWY